MLILTRSCPTRIRSNKDLDTPISEYGLLSLRDRLRHERFRFSRYRILMGELRSANSRVLRLNEHNRSSLSTSKSPSINQRPADTDLPVRVLICIVSSEWRASLPLHIYNAKVLTFVPLKPASMYSAEGKTNGD